jgi:hypothetical protein
MSDSSSQESVCCPQCTTRFETELVRVLQPGDPAFEQLFAGSLNRAKCPGCGTVFQVDVEQLIFKDPETPYILVQTAPPEESEIDNLEEEIDCLATDAAYQQGLERPMVRLVFNREEFLEKIFLHYRGLDDRLVEYAKFQLFQTIGDDDLMPTQHRLLYDFSNSDEEKMQFIVFDRESAKASAYLHLPMADFLNMAKEFEQNENLQLELEQVFPSCVVHVDRLYE